MPFAFHLQSITMVAGMLYLLMALTVWAMLLRRHPRRPARLWSLGWLAGGLGLLLIQPRHTLPDWVIYQGAVFTLEWSLPLRVAALRLDLGLPLYPGRLLGGCWAAARNPSSAPECWWLARWRWPGMHAPWGSPRRRAAAWCWPGPKRRPPPAGWSAWPWSCAAAPRIWCCTRPGSLSGALQALRQLLLRPQVAVTIARRRKPWLSPA